MMSENASGEATSRWYTDERLVILAIGVLGLLSQNHKSATVFPLAH